MKNRCTLIIVILFATHSLFSAHEFNGPYRLCIEDKSFQKSPDRKKLTKELRLLVGESNEDTFKANSSIMQALIRNGARANLIGANLIGHRSPLPLLSIVCCADDIDFVKVCVVNGARLKTVDEDGNSALYSCKSLPVLRYLLEAQADPNHQNRWGRTVLHDAVRGCRSIEIIEELCRHIVPSHENEKEAPLWCLCKTKNTKQDFERKLATLLWWSESQLEIKDRGRSYQYYLEQEEIAVFDAISEEITRARAQFFNQKIQEAEVVIEEFVPIGSVTSLICSYSGPSSLEPPYMSLRDFMASEESKREYPAIAQTFLPKELT